MEQPIEIIIRKSGGFSSNSGDSFNSTMKPSKEGAGKSSLVKDATTTALINAGKTLLNSGARQFTQFTGSSLLQKDIENFSNTASMISSVLKGGLVGIVSVGTQIASGVVSTGLANIRTNYEADLLYQRSGNASIDGGRGTHD